MAYSQVRSTDANVDDCLDLFASIPLPFSTANLLRELFHVLQDFVVLLDNALAVHLHGLVGDIAESNVVDSSLLGEVDLLSRKHLISKFLELGFLCEIDEKFESLLGQEVLGKVKEDVGAICLILEDSLELLESLRVLLEFFLQDNVSAHGVVVLNKSLPCAEVGCLGESRHVEGFAVDLEGF